MHQDVIAAINLSALMEMGPATTVQGFPRARVVGSLLFVEVSSLANTSCEAVWRNAFPSAPMLAGVTIGPLLDPGMARQAGLQWVALGPKGTVPVQAGAARFDGKYYVRGVSHKYNTGESGGYQTQFGRKRP